MKFSNRGQLSCIFKSSRGQKGMKMQKIPHKFKVLRKQHSMILINPVTIEKIPLCRHWKLAVLGRWPLLRGDCLWRFHFNHENTVEWKLYRGVPCLWFLQFLGPLRWNISRSDQHASCMNLHKWSPLNNSNLSITSSFQCLHSDHLPTTATFMLWVAI